jgi:hypothetical protein
VKVNYLTLVAGAAIALISAAVTQAGETASSALASENKAAPLTPSTTASTAAAPAAPSEDTATYYDDSDPVRDFIVRAGAWGVHQTGSPYKVDEYQSGNSSPFWNADGIWSNGEQTIDFSATGSDDLDQDGRLHFYGGPRLEADLFYEQFPHQLDAKTYPGWTTVQGANNVNGPNFNVYSRNDFSPGQDYAIQVQEFKANFKGNLTDNLKWRVNVFGIDKEGYRQANSVAHCYDSGTSTATLPPPFNTIGTNPAVNRQCHAVSQAQHIDWQTTELDAGLELRLDCNTTLAYSHLVRAFNQNDQQVINLYRSGSNGFPIGLPAPNTAFSTAGYNIVPDNQTQIDRLKFSTNINCDTDAYLLGYVGYNEDMLRYTYRNFNGADLRITNRSVEHWAITGYGKYYRQDSTEPLVALNTLYPSQAAFYQEPNLAFISPQVNREVHGAGIDGRWRPFEDECDTLRRNLSFTVGYDYNAMLYENATDSLAFVPAGNANGVFVVNRIFTQPSTIANTFSLGMEEKWSKSFDTQLRYVYVSTQYPLYGITPEAGQSINAALSSSLPTQENRLELEGTWTPTDCLMVNATIYVENAMSNAPYVGNATSPGWTSNSLPFTLSAWWAPTCDWSFNVGFAEMDSWINQGVSAGPLNSSADGINVPWAFRGASDVFTIGSRYQATCKLSFVGQFEYVHGINSNFAIVPSAAQTPPTGAAYDLGQWSLVKEQSFRFECGADYLLRPRVTTYIRYDYYDFQDLSTGLLSGTQNSVLGGVSAVF